MGSGIYNLGKEEDFIVDKQDEFIAYQACLFQMITGDKFLPGLLALTGSEVLIFNDYAPSEKIGVMNVYHPMFTLQFKNIKFAKVTKLNGNHELSKYVELSFLENIDGKITTVFFKKNAKNFKKICKLLKKVGNIKIKKTDMDCSIYN